VTRRLSITSTSNDRLKAVRRLRRRCDRERAGVFLAEGERELRRALDADATILEVFSCAALHLGRREAELVARAERRGARVVELGAAAFASISGRARPDGVAATIARPSTRLTELQPRRRPVLLVAEGIERPGNLGTIVRTACAAGVDALLVCDAPTDVFHPDSVRSAVGTLLHVPLAETSSAAAIAWLCELGVPIVVAAPGSVRPYWELGYGDGAAIVVGSERHGVGDDWLAAADEAVAIPMAAPADSLNVAVAAGIVLFEATRRRAAQSSARPKARM
jgi:TrmH family RNA methyltransferase